MSPAEHLHVLRAQGGAYSLSSRARVRISGSDAFRYLNSQLTNDLAQLPPQGSQQALLLTAKGKLCVPVHVWKSGEAMILDADPNLGQALVARVERYIVADDVVVESQDTPDAGWHIFGSAADSADGRPVCRLGMEGVDCADLPSGIQVASPEEVEILRIQHGIPVWGRELDETTLPQEARLERNAVDFHKGCYVGQETVSRIQSVGHTNRILVGLVFDDPVDFVRDDAYTLASDETPVGKMTSWACDFELARTIALGYIKTRLEEKVLHVTDSDGHLLGKATIHELPLV